MASLPPALRINRSAAGPGAAARCAWRPWGRWAVVMLVVATVTGCGDESSRFRILAASSLTEVVPELSAVFSAGTPGDVEYSFAGTNRLARQIEEGAPADVFLSANTRWDEYLHERGLTENGTDHVFAENRLVLIVPRDAAANVSLEDVLAGSRRVALAGESVPAGQYADLALANAGLLEGVRPKVVRGDNVSLVLHWVATGEVAAGIVYQTDARRRAGEVTVAHTFDVAAHGPIEYTAAAVTAGRRLPRARAFLDFLRAEEAREILARHGFTPR